VNAKMKKLFVIAMLTAVTMALTSCGIVDRFLGGDDLVEAVNQTPPPLPEPTPEPVAEPLPAFLGFSGIVRDVAPFFDLTVEGPAQVDGKYFLLVEDNGNRIVFLQDENTTRLAQVALEPGTAITGFFDTSIPVPVTYPPQYRARFLMPASAFHVMVDRFDENLRSSCGMFSLHLDESTEILREDGEPFYGIPENQILIVEFEEEGFNIIPIRITALFEQAINPIQPIEVDIEQPPTQAEFNVLLSYFDERLRSSCGSFVLIVYDNTKILDEDGEPFEGDIANHLLQVTYEGDGPIIFPTSITVIHTEETPNDDIRNPDEDNLAVDTPLSADDNPFNPATTQIIVNGTPIEAATPFVDSATGVVMVPIEAIAQALGHAVLNDGCCIVIGQSEPLRSRINSFALEGNSPRPLGAPPAVLDEIMFVPWDYFTEILGIEITIVGGNVIINE